VEEGSFTSFNSIYYPYNDHFRHSIYTGKQFKKITKYHFSRKTSYRKVQDSKTSLYDCMLYFNFSLN